MLSKGAIHEKIRQYHFELRHVLIVFIILVTVQLLTSLVQKFSLQDFLLETQESYQEDSAERIANLTAISLELLLEETSPRHLLQNPDIRSKIVETFNIILSQQLLLRDVEELCVLVSDGDSTFAIDNGQVLYDYFWNNLDQPPPSEVTHVHGIRLYSQLRDEIESTEKIHSILEGKQTFHVFVPFVPKGEYAGAVYMKNSPDFSGITKQVISTFNSSNLIFTGLILFGLLAMFYISSYTLRERDETRELLFKEKESQIAERVHYAKEALFAKRIYHTHHKAEKIMGFIKEDLNLLSSKNINEIKERVAKYASFISRVIYDMKWYEPPIQAIRNPLFKTNLNEVIQFIVKNVCMRNATASQMYEFELHLDENLPTVHINEFVVWEILEPLLQNAIDHNEHRKISINVMTKYFPIRKESEIWISDDGKGIPEELLHQNSHGVKAVFLENTSTKISEHNSGYGCYLAYEIARERCGWRLDVMNTEGGGCRFVIVVPN